MGESINLTLIVSNRPVCIRTYPLIDLKHSTEVKFFHFRQWRDEIFMGEFHCWFHFEARAAQHLESNRAIRFYKLIIPLLFRLYVHPSGLYRIRSSHLYRRTAVFVVLFSAFRFTAGFPSPIHLFGLFNVVQTGKWKKRHTKLWIANQSRAEQTKQKKKL